MTTETDRYITVTNAVAAVIHFGVAAFVAYEVSEHAWEAPFVVQYSKWNQTNDERCSTESQCLITEASVDWGTANVGLIVPFFSFISGLHHLIVALWVGCNGSDGYIAMATGGNWLRAIDYALSASLMLVVTSILFRSPPDATTLMLVAAVQSAIILIGYLLERIQAPRYEAQGKSNETEESMNLLRKNNTGESISTWKVFKDNCRAVGVPFLASIFIYSLVWTSLLIPFGYAVSDAPVAVIIFIVYLVLTFTLFPIVFMFSKPGIGRETGFLLLSMLAKVPLLMLFYFGVVARSGTVVFDRLEGSAFNTTGSPSSASDADLYSAFGGTIGAVAVVAAIMYWKRV